MNEEVPKENIRKAEFVNKANKKHNFRYKYVNFIYINSKTKGLITCNIHGDFSQTPCDHLSGCGCKHCGRLSSKLKLTSNTENFIKEAEIIHGYKYDYSLVDYNKSTEEVKIICKTIIRHGVFKQKPFKHLQGQGCPKCGRNHQYTTEEFIEEAKIIHGDNKYDYSLVKYVDNETEIIIICDKHCEFRQTPHSHLSGRGCHSCGKENSAKYRRYSTEEFIEKANRKHNFKYKYDLVQYGNNGFENVIITCIEHGNFEQTPNAHLQGAGCSKCVGKYQYTTIEFIEKANKIHNFKYNYHLCEYVNSQTYIKIICNKHGEFPQKANSHLRGIGCPTCVNKTESKLFEKIKPIYPTLRTHFKVEWCKNNRCLPFDFCIPELKIIIELDGPQHFRQVSNWSSPEEQFENDKYKEKCANDNDYSVIRILQEDVLNDIYDWAKDLCNAIEEIKNGDEVVNVYLCKNDEYDAF